MKNSLKFTIIGFGIVFVIMFLANIFWPGGFINDQEAQELVPITLYQPEMDKDPESGQSIPKECGLIVAVSGRVQMVWTTDSLTAGPYDLRPSRLVIPYPSQDFRQEVRLPRKRWESYESIRQAAVSNLQLDPGFLIGRWIKGPDVYLVEKYCE